ncbi:MAG: hypothetical protein D6795_04515 [Deltaproteobacteria bacterium]|nr:MAG: hypothetical protein D6795_04515 [Deltaproteobacteria bacterium]
MRIALFGGSFNPPHLGHVGFCRLLLGGGSPEPPHPGKEREEEKLGEEPRGERLPPIEVVWMIPCYTHPFGKPLAPFEDRLAMCERAIPEELTGRIVVSAVEAEIRTGRTIDLIRHLLGRHPEHAFFFAVGSDILDEVHRWKDFGEIQALVPLIVIPRVGWEKGGAHAPLPDIRSREIRRRIAAGEPYRDLVPPAVADYIEKKGLYR